MMSDVLSGFEPDSEFKVVLAAAQDGGFGRHETRTDTGVSR